MKNMWDKSEI